MLFFPGRTVNECVAARTQLSMLYPNRDRHSSGGSAGSNHGDYPPISQAMRSPPTLQPSIQPPHPPGGYPSSVMLLSRPVANGLMPGPATTTTAITMPVAGGAVSQKPPETRVDVARTVPRKRGRPSRADRAAKQQLRPLLPQHLMPRPTAYEQQQLQMQMQQVQAPANAQYIQRSLVPLATYRQSSLPASTTPPAERNSKKRRRNATPDRLPSVGDMMTTPPPRKEE